MATAHPQIRVGFARCERSRHGIATMSVRRSRPETRAAEFDWVRGWLGLPRAMGAQRQWCRSQGRRALRATYGRWSKFDTIADFFGRYVVAKQLRFNPRVRTVVQRKLLCLRTHFLAHVSLCVPKIGFSGAAGP